MTIWQAFIMGIVQGIYGIFTNFQFRSFGDHPVFAGLVN